MNAYNKNEKSLKELKKEIKKLETKYKNKQSIQIAITPEIFNKLKEERKISKELEEWYLANQEEHNKKKQDFLNFMQNNPQIPEENRIAEYYKQLIATQNTNPKQSQKESCKTVLNLEQLFNIVSHEIKETQSTTNSISPLFKKHVDHKNAIGFVKLFSDRVIYFRELSEKAQLVKTKDGAFIIIAELAGVQKNIGTIGLEHDLQTKDPIEAKKYLDYYIECMKGDALKVLLAYWAQANDETSFNYFSSLTSIVKHNIENNRKPSSKEKTRFWSLSKMLINTKLTFDFKLENQYIKTIQPLLMVDITTSKNRNQEISKGYPDKVNVTVLDPDIFKKAATLATEISRGTLKLRGEDIMLALNIETRTAQTRSKTDLLQYREEQLMELAGLIKTYNANPRVARQRLRAKLNNIAQANSIDTFQENKGNYAIKKRQSKKDIEK